MWRVGDAEPAGDQDGDARARPALIVPAVRDRTLVQERIQPHQLAVGELAAGPGGALGDQRALPALEPGPVSLAGGFTRHAQQVGHPQWLDSSGEHVRRPKPQRLTPLSLRAGQSPASVRVPHTPRLSPGQTVRTSIPGQLVTSRFLRQYDYDRYRRQLRCLTITSVITRQGGRCDQWGGSRPEASGSYGGRRQAGASAHGTVYTRFLNAIAQKSAHAPN